MLAPWKISYDKCDLVGIPIEHGQITWLSSYVSIRNAASDLVAWRRYIANPPKPATLGFTVMYLVSSGTRILERRAKAMNALRAI